ncbi:putative disease resistance protein At3g14460 [Vigna unguiculata]|uniref:putative disease resistance protein At3g14460 n=1 Tax=Vigna unguiculata TaxID=3917 RepID=UPI0010169CC2|nr:putative disease resistance protein At3g14460 [Vigna unguiculata]
MPVLETLGGALFGAVLQVLFHKLDSHQVLDYFRGRKLNEKLLKNLRRKLVSINAVVDHAEQKKFRNAYVKTWLDDVRDVLLDTEDLLDEIHYEFLKSESELEYQSSAIKVRSFECKLKEVLDDLEFLLNQKDDLGLKNVCGVVSELGNKLLEGKNESSSLVVEDIIYGRDEDKEIILNWLTSDNGNRNHLSILAIVGMGGMGKTTLAQHVYNDPKMKEVGFDEKAWVCVSDEFDVLKVSKAIIGAFTKSRDDSEDIEMVHGKLKEKLTGRKFLLVLDDVWNEDRNQWKTLQTPLRYGAKGSKVLVTTRSNKVASIMQSSSVHQLKQLQKYYSWQVFAKHALQDDNSTLSCELEEIGTKIVEKCKGMPLALETLGCLLRTKSSVSEWEGVLTSEIWDLSIEDSKIIPALLLSYYHLPSHLKRCFAYCALFPKDHKFDRETLIQLWMAESFLQCSRQSKCAEEVGEQYFNDLLSRSFFQQSINDNETCFVMHDLHNDLAKYVCGEICFRLGVDRAERVPKTTRHFSTVIDPVQDRKSLCDAKGLRTFISFSADCEISIQELVSNFKFLRVLSLSCYKVKEVSDIIGNLIHLRSLDLSNTGIKKLPDSTCSLCNLQVLKLNNCFNLQELPSSLHKLTNLRRFELVGTTLRKAPILLGKLKNLQVWMGRFDVGKNSQFGIQLGELDLYGQLSIRNLENIMNPYDALAADLKNKTHLVALYLEWSLRRNNEDSIKEREVLENLQPSRHLKHLLIDGYGGTHFPRWLSDNSLSNVESLTLNNCRYCQRLPSLGLLTFLKHLTIRGLDWLVRIDADFYGNSCSAFASLETLSFIDMKEWEEWECMTGAFLSLQHLSVTNCPKLKGHLPEQLSHLKILTIDQCEQIEASIPKGVEIEDVKMEASSFDMIGPLVFDTPLESLSIYSCPGINMPLNHWYSLLVELDISESCDSLTNFPLDIFPKLCDLCLNECHNLQMISQGHPHSHLKSLTIQNCYKFESFPCEGLFATQLESFCIEELDRLKSMPRFMSVLLPSLNYLSIRDCPGVEFSDGCLPSNLKEMRLFNCSKLVASLKGVWGTNPSLKSLYIREVDVEFFQSEGFLPLSLTNLEIYDCPNLKKLDYEALSPLSSLEKLDIVNCPSLHCLPEEGLPKSILELGIKSCPLLKQRCKKEEGEDWAKIAHIKTIWVDFEQVNIEDEARVGKY